MSTALPAAPRSAARTAALADALSGLRDRGAEADLLFLEAWEIRPTASVGSALRAQQLRRANPALAAAIRAELHGPLRPLR